MTIQINGTSGISGVDGTAGTPALQGTDTNTGISFGTDEVNINTGGTTRATVDSSGRVGIGTSAPAALLEASSATGSATPTPTEIRLSSTTSAADWSTTDPWARVGFYSADTTGGARLRGAIDTIQTFSNGNVSSLAFKLDDASTGLVERMRITYDGKVGIGTTTVDELLHIEQSVNNYGPAFKISNPNTNRWGGKIDFESATGAGTYTAATIKADGGGGFGSGNLIVETAGSERCRVDGSGRLLVGTSTARSNFFNSTESTKLQVEGTVTSDSSISVVRNSNNTGYPFIAFGKTRGTAVGGSTIVQSGDSVGGLEFMGSDGTEFVPAGSIRCEIDGTPGANDMPGRLVFSTTADGTSSPTERLRISSEGRWTTYSTASTAYTFATSKASGTTDILIQGEYNSTGVGSGSTSFRVLSNGNVQNTNNSYGAISDIKLKENIVDASSQWDDLKAIQVRNYNFKEGQTHTQIGLIAQEVEPISPGLVYESPDRDEDGNDLGTTTKSVNYSVLYMKAVKALQEAMERIEQLETRLTALEGGTN